MRRNIEMDNAASLMREDDKDVENAERDCRDGEEINRGKLLSMVFQKGAPTLRRWFRMSEHVFGDRCLENVDSKLAQFAMNSRGSQEGIIFTHRADELTNLLGYPGSSRLALPAFPGPKQSKSLAMPSDDGFRFNNDKGRAPLWPIAKEPNPEEAVPRSKFWAVGGTLQDDDLVSQSEDFGLECETRSKAGEEG